MLVRNNMDIDRDGLSNAPAWPPLPHLLLCKIGRQAALPLEDDDYPSTPHFQRHILLDSPAPVHEAFESMYLEQKRASPENSLQVETHNLSHDMHKNQKESLHRESAHISLEFPQHEHLFKMPQNHKLANRGDAVQPQTKAIAYKDGIWSTGVAVNIDDGDTKTMMLCNIPCCIQKDRIVQVLHEKGFDGTFIYIYLPTRKINKYNLGYAFVGFRHSDDAKRFARTFRGFRFAGTFSNKMCDVKCAHCQGIDPRVKTKRPIE